MSLHRPVPMISLLLAILFLLSFSFSDDIDTSPPQRPPKQKPLIVIVALPHFSHLTVFLPVAAELSSRGYDVIYPNDAKYKSFYDKIEEKGPYEGVNTGYVDLYGRFGPQAEKKRKENFAIYAEGLVRITAGESESDVTSTSTSIGSEFGVSVEQRLRALCQLACGGSWWVPEFKFIPSSGSSGSSVSLFEARKARIDELVMAYHLLFFDLYSAFSGNPENEREIFLVVDSVIPWMTGTRIGEEFGWNRILFDTTAARLRKNPFTYPSYVADTLVSQFGFGTAIKQVFQQIGLMITCPGLLKRAGKMSWANDIVQILPTVIGLDRFVGMGDSTPMRRYVGFIGLSDETRGLEMNPQVKKWLDDPAHVVSVYVSAGSQMAFPDIVLERSMQVFEKLNVSVLLLVGKSVELPDAFVKKWKERRGEDLLVWRKWINQNAVLKHKHSRLMLAHAGNGGIIEAIRTTTPVVAVPMSFDQYNGASRLVEAGIGNRIVSLDDVDPDVLFHKINDILFGRPEFYRANLRKLDSLSKLAGEEKTAADVIEEVMLHGTDHLQPFVAPFLDTISLLWKLMLLLLILWYGWARFRKLRCRERTPEAVAEEKVKVD